MSYKERLAEYLKEADKGVLQFKSRLPMEYTALLRDWIQLHEQLLEVSVKLNEVSDRVAVTRPDLQYKAAQQKETLAEAEESLKNLGIAFKSFRLRMRRDQDGKSLGDDIY